MQRRGRGARARGRDLALPPSGTAIVNADDPHAQVWRDAARAAGARVVDFALAQRAASPRALHARPTAPLAIVDTAGRVDVALAVPGRHMAGNALAAAAAALAAGVPFAAIARGLAAFRAVRGPPVARAPGWRRRVIDDTYNANPDSVRAAIDVLARHRARAVSCWATWAKWARKGPAFHREIGAYARERGHRAPVRGRRLARRRRARHSARAPRTSRRSSALAGRAARGTPAATRARQGLALHAHGARVAALDRRGRGGAALMLLWLAELARAGHPRVQRVQLHHAARGAGDA